MDWVFTHWKWAKWPLAAWLLQLRRLRGAPPLRQLSKSRPLSGWGKLWGAWGKTLRPKRWAVWCSRVEFLGNFFTSKASNGHWIDGMVDAHAPSGQRSRHKGSRLVGFASWFCGRGSFLQHLKAILGGFDPMSASARRTRSGSDCSVNEASAIAWEDPLAQNVRRKVGANENAAGRLDGTRKVPCFLTFWCFCWSPRPLISSGFLLKYHAVCSMKESRSKFDNSVCQGLQKGLWMVLECSRELNDKKYWLVWCLWFTSGEMTIQRPLTGPWASRRCRHSWVTCESSQRRAALWINKRRRQM